MQWMMSLGVPQIPFSGTAWAMWMCVGYLWSGQDFVRSKKMIIQSHALWLFDGKGKNPFMSGKMQDKEEFRRVGQNGAAFLRKNWQGNKLSPEKSHCKISLMMPCQTHPAGLPFTTAWDVLLGPLKSSSGSVDFSWCIMWWFATVGS